MAFPRPTDGEVTGIHVGTGESVLASTETPQEDQHRADLTVSDSEVTSHEDVREVVSRQPGFKDGTEGLEYDNDPREDWRPAAKHTGSISTAVPAPHHSDGGVLRGATVYSPVAYKDRAEPCPSTQTQKPKRAFVRLPKTASIRAAVGEGQVGAFASHGPRGRFVTLSREEAERRARGGVVRQFYGSSSLLVNIDKATQWASVPGMRWCDRLADRGCSTKKPVSATADAQKRVRFDASAAVFTPSSTKPDGGDTGRAATRRGDMHGYSGITLDVRAKSFMPSSVRREVSVTRRQDRHDQTAKSREIPGSLASNVDTRQCAAHHHGENATMSCRETECTIYRGNLSSVPRGDAVSTTLARREVSSPFEDDAEHNERTATRRQDIHGQAAKSKEIPGDLASSDSIRRCAAHHHGENAPTGCRETECTNHRSNLSSVPRGDAVSKTLARREVSSPFEDDAAHGGRTSTQSSDECCVVQGHDHGTEVASTLPLRELLKHKQVSHVIDAPADVREKMDEYCVCSPRNMVLDLKNKSASQVQKELRSALVRDLRQGSDTAAFVFDQLGLDNVPRADQLELMIAAMPGVDKIIFEGDTVESGLNLEAWKRYHAGHCDQGCSSSTICDRCYFKVVHNFMRQGFEPALKEGRSWDDLKTKTEAYVGAWRQDEQRCEAAWKKWEHEAEGLLSPPQAAQPKLVVPLLPATRSKHLWRYMVHGIPYKVRLCLDLKAAGVNEATADWRFRYRGLDDIASSIRKGDWLASIDISRFYLRLPAGRNLRNAQWIQDPTTYGKDARANKRSSSKLYRQLQAVGFGLKTAPAWASVVSAELVRILESEGIRVVGCFLDDLLIAGATKDECEFAWRRAKEIMAELGIPANEKAVPPQAPRVGITFLGVHIRTADMRFAVSAEHRQYAIDRIRTVLKSRSASKGDLASIAGVLTWISFVFTPGRPRRQFIYDAARLGTTGRKSDVVPIRGALERQLRWWFHSLRDEQFTGTRIWDSHASPKTTLMHSDASGEDGWGSCIHGLHFAGPWPAELRSASMLFKEMVPVAITIALISPAMPETVFGIAVDNTGVAFAVNKLSCRDKMTSRLLQQLTSDLARHGHTALGAHVRRDRNQHADALSHALINEMWRRIIKQQLSRSKQQSKSYWRFPFVAQCVTTGACYTGIFRMRKSIFAKIDDAAL